jgi:3'(2'), 5'-bisphosphate nucleotidase
LDGTKEFISRNGEFTVNIALIQMGQPVAGVVYAPVFNRAYLGACNLGAFRVDNGAWQAIKTSPRDAHTLRVVGSRRHGAEAMDNLLDRLRSSIPNIELRNVGSSLKFCLIAEGQADFYPRLAPTSEWDTAAAQAVLEAAGGLVVDLDKKPLRYNKSASLLNPSFYALGNSDTDWLG